MGLQYENGCQSGFISKKGVTISKLALNLLSKDVGDRIAPISYYQEEFQVSRGTMQNAFNYLKDIGAVTLAHHGHQGTYIEALDYVKLQENCLQQEIMGIMPLPYSQTYEGFATAIYEQLKKLKFNMAYARGLWEGFSWWNQGPTSLPSYPSTRRSTPFPTEGILNA